MSLGAKILLLIFVVPLIGFFLWAFLRKSIVTIPVGRLGLLVIKGRPTERVLLPGPHWVPALRKRTAVEYPALEMSYRATAAVHPAESEHEAQGPPLQVTLGDRTQALIEYTVRFRLDPLRLPLVHDRFGPNGIWAVVRDESARAIIAELGEPDATVLSTFGAERAQMQERVGAATADALDAIGIPMTRFTLGTVDLGRTGQTIQAVVRARFELEREEAEAATRLARVRNDAKLAPHLAAVGEMALRYRQTDVWRDFMSRPDAMAALTLPPVGASLPVPHDGEAGEPPPAPAEGDSAT